jgi:hypothetical protein
MTLAALDIHAGAGTDKVIEEHSYCRAWPHSREAKGSMPNRSAILQGDQARQAEQRSQHLFMTSRRSPYNGARDTRLQAPAGSPVVTHS